MYLPMLSHSELSQLLWIQGKESEASKRLDDLSDAQAALDEFYDAGVDTPAEVLALSEELETERSAREDAEDELRKAEEKISELSSLVEHLQRELSKPGKLTKEAREELLETIEDSLESMS